MDQAEIRALAREVSSLGVQTRRWLHQHPELSFQERETSAYLAEQLRQLGYEPEVGVGGGYGIKAVLRGAEPGPTIALRADIDALPIQEETGLSFASVRPGVMHACGHDMHASILLATAKALREWQPRLRGNVVFIFQPAEESLPGGAIGMIRDGVLENPHVDAIFGMHVDPLSPVGTLGFGSGRQYAAADFFDITIFGRGGHGAAPHQTIDSVVVGAQVVNALQHIHSRQIDPWDQLVISVGHFQAGSKHNIIADQALLQGTVRTMNPTLHSRVPEMMEKITAGVCAAYGATFRLDYQKGYPVLENDEAMTQLAMQAAVNAVGATSVFTRGPAMYGEDFSYYLVERPGSFGSLGVAAPGETELFPCHHPRLKVQDEAAMPIGVSYFLSLVATYLNL